jgi:hypothetical protein
MFLEAGFFSRPKQGIYASNEKLNLSYNITKEIYVESFKQNKETKEIQDYELMDPYFEFINNN